MRSKILRALIALAPCVALSPASALAQTRFQWPDTSVDVTKYDLAECEAAIERVRLSAHKREATTVWYDTLPRDPRFQMRPLPAPVTETATRCAARTQEPTVDLHDWDRYFRLFLTAGRDSDAARLVTRRLAAATSARERDSVVDRVVRLYLFAPPRLAAAEELLLRRARESPDRVERLLTYMKLLMRSRDAGDTARARRAAERMLPLGDSLTAAERQPSEEYEEYGGLGLMLYMASEELIPLQVRMDSLRKSTATMVALMRDNWSRHLRIRPEGFQEPIGERAPVLTADYWFPNEAGGAPRPTRGRVAFVVFLEHDGCLRPAAMDDLVYPTCAYPLYRLRRLAQRFPALEIIIVTSTHGAFMYVPPPTPADEAALIRQWLDTDGVPGAVVAVTSTPFFRVGDLDGRRIEKDPPNRSRYGFGKRFPIAFSYVIDPDGIIAWYGGASFEVEQDAVIDVLLHRQSTGS